VEQAFGLLAWRLMPALLSYQFRNQVVRKLVIEREQSYHKGREKRINI
jgi:hypothetical protein